MDPISIGVLMFFCLIVAILLGMYVGVALGAFAVVGLWWIKGSSWIALKVLATTSYSAVMDYVFGVVPMFIIMGAFAVLSGASEDLYDAADALFGRIKGGLAIATVLANALCAAITGVSVASAAIFSQIALPEMLRLGYDRKFALGTVAGSSALGMLIPPSVLFIVYGVLSEQAIGKLFIAGILPGCLLAAGYCVGIFVMVAIWPQLAPVSAESKVLTFGRFARAILKPWLFVVLVVLTLGGLYVGWFTPTEAGAVGASGAFLYALIRRRVTPSGLWNVLLQSGYVTASIFFLLISAQMYARMMTVSGLPAAVSKWVIALPVSPIMVILIFLLVFIILGCFMDSISMMLICMPLMLPVVRELGFDLIWFGVIAVVAIEMGFTTPPFGLVVFAMKSALGDQATLEEIFAGAAPFLLMMFVVLIVLIAVPSISTWLPGMMAGAR